MTNYVKTTNFLRKDSLPDASTEKIIRGSEFDTEFNNLVIAVASKANLISPILTGIPTAPTASAGSATTQLATTAFASAAAAAAFPTGGIIMWSGSIATIPVNWNLCDGSSGTPDLRNRFILGAGSTYAPSATGGSHNATLPAHNHSASSSVSDPGHVHNYTEWYARNSYDGGVVTPTATRAANTSRSTTGISVSTSIGSKGTSATNANMPLYFALAYIMKS